MPGIDDPFTVNRYRAHAAHSVIAQELQTTGCPFSNCVADLLLKALLDAGFVVVKE
jgi:hypothetical protein